MNAGPNDERGRTTLSWAAEGGREKLVSLLLDRADVEVERLWSNVTGIGSSWMPRDPSQAANKSS